MKTIDFTNKGIGQSLSPDYTDDLQESTRAKFESLLKALTASSNAVVILHGCEITVDGSDYSMTAGVVYYQGRIYTAPAYPVTTAPGGQVPVWTLQKTYTKQARYGDNVLRDTFFNDEIVMQMGAPGSGLADYDQVVDIIDLLAVPIIAKLTDGAPAALDTLNEIAAALNDDEDVYNTLVGLINQKVANTNWVNGSFLLGDYILGVTGLGGAPSNHHYYKYKVVGDILHLFIASDGLQTNNDIVRVKLPDAVKSRYITYGSDITERLEGKSYFYAEDGTLHSCYWHKEGVSSFYEYLTIQRMDGANVSPDFSFTFVGSINP